MDHRKLQVALYWGAGCGGCDVAVLDTNAFILELAEAATIRFWPIAVDGKYDDLRAMADGELDLALVNGAVRNSENEAIARVLRQKSRLLVAFGSCAHLGGIPGLANRFPPEQILETVYLNNPSIQEGNRLVPHPESHVGGRTLDLPQLYRRVYPLDAIVEVDYFLPGCPPAPEQVEAVLRAVVAGTLPPRRSVIGAADHTLCEDCRRKKTEKKISRFHRPHEILADPQGCLLEQGILCAGPATRSGCGVRCPNAGLPCRGCYGPMTAVTDQGAKLLSAVAAVIDSRDPEEIDAVLDGLPDFVGYAYRFGMPAALLERSPRP